MRQHVSINMISSGTPPNCPSLLPFLTVATNCTNPLVFNATLTMSAVLLSSTMFQR